MPFPGFRSAVEAFTGGDAIQHQAATAEQVRLLRQRNQQALLDQRLEAVIEAKRTNRAGAGIEGNDSLSQLLRDLTLSGTGSSFSAGQTGIRTGQKITAANAAAALAGSDEPNLNAFNLQQLLSGGTAVTPTGVDPHLQSEQNILFKKAQIGAQEASAALSEGKLDALTTGSDVKFDLAPGTTLESALGITDPTNFLAGLDTSEIKKFIPWQGQQALIDPRFNNGDFALAMFLNKDSAGNPDPITADRLKALETGVQVVPPVAGEAPLTAEEQAELDALRLQFGR